MEYKIIQCSNEQYYHAKTYLYSKNRRTKQVPFRKVIDSNVHVITDSCDKTSWSIIKHVILGFVTILILYICNICGKDVIAGNAGNLCSYFMVNYTENNLTGKWRWNSGDNYFELILKQYGNNITGTYGAIWGSSSMDIDDGNTLNGNIDGNVVRVKFISAAWGGEGSAIITILSENKIKWKLLNTEGWCRVPDEAILNREVFSNADKSNVNTNNIVSSTNVVLLDRYNTTKHIPCSGYVTAKGTSSVIYQYGHQFDDVLTPTKDPYTFHAEIFVEYSFFGIGRGRVLNATDKKALVKVTCLDGSGLKDNVLMLDIAPGTFRRIIFSSIDGYGGIVNKIKVELVKLY